MSNHISPSCCALILLSLLTGPGCTQNAKYSTSPTAPSSFAEMAGEDLIRALIEPSACARAFYELSRRASFETESDFDDFQNTHRKPEVIVCPQGEGKKPLYVVLYDPFSRIAEAWKNNTYRLDNPDTLFPPIVPRKLRKRRELAMQVFTAEGRAVNPFRHNDNVLDEGILTDFNGDGLIERAGYIRFGIESVQHAHVFKLDVMLERERPLLAVAYNFGLSDDWDYEFTDRDGDGRIDIEFGPKTADGIKTKVVYRWDSAQQAFVGPAGEKDDHFRKLDPADLHRELKRLQEEGVAFKRDSDAEGPEIVTGQDPVVVLIGSDHAFSSSGGNLPSLPATSPYRYASLRGMSDDEILRYMGCGRSVRDVKAAAVIRTCVAKDFWTLPPKDAALATADANRTERHRRRVRLALDDAGRKPPGAGVLLFSNFNPHSPDCHFFLKFDPKESYCVYIPRWFGRYFRRFDVTYEEARHMAQAVWWLDRVRSTSHKKPFTRLSSSVDGTGTLQILPEGGGDALWVTNTIWPGAVSERWSGEYDPEVFLNLTAHLVLNELPQRLGERLELDMEHQRETIGNILDLFSKDARLISYPIVTEAVQAVGNLNYVDMADRLKAVEAGLGDPAPPASNEAPLKYEIRNLRDAVYRSERDKTSNEYKSGWDRLNVLFSKQEAVQTGASISEAREDLRKSVAFAFRQMSAAGDPEALQAWAASRQPGNPWALRQLERMAPERYVKALEWRLKDAQGDEARQFFEDIARVNPKRARELALELPPDRKGDLTVQAFIVLDEAKTIPDEPKRVSALIQVFLDPKSGWLQRGQAIECLVPPNAPLKYPDRRIDEALLKCLEPHLADDQGNWTLGKACRALARRGRVEHFDAIVAALNASKDTEANHGIIGALAHMARQGGASVKSRLIPVLKPHLRQTNLMITEIIWAIWAADLRELKGDLEAIATARPEEPEGPKASHYRGTPEPVKERYHLARQVAAVWNEEDAVTRIRLLIALGLSIDKDKPERQDALRQEIGRLSGLMTPGQSQDVRRFLEWVEREYQLQSHHPVTNIVRAAFQWPLIGPSTR